MHGGAQSPSTFDQCDENLAEKKLTILEFILVVLQFFVVLYLFITTIQNHPINSFMSISNLAVGIPCLICSAVSIFEQTIKFCVVNEVSNKLGKNCHNKSYYLANLWIFLLILYVDMGIIEQLLNKEDDSERIEFFCLHTIALIFPFVLFTVFTGYLSGRVMAVVWVIQCVLVISTALFEYIESIDLLLVLYWLIMFANLSYLTYNSQDIYKKNRQMILELQQHFGEQAAIIDKEKTQELKRNHQQARAMIANAAHDLKTPLSSLMMSLEILQEKAQQLRDIVLNSETNNHQPNNVYINTGMKNQPLASVSVSELMNTVREACDMNLFMLAAINRLQDFAKIDKGIKLLPKLETIPLWESLALPLTCMNNSLRNTTAIGDDESVPYDSNCHREVVNPIKLFVCEGPTICSHVITDKQWLQENLLCLLSNAVKYSSNNQEVLVRVSLERTINPPSKPVVTEDLTIQVISQSSSKNLKTTEEIRPIETNNTYAPKVLKKRNLMNYLSMPWKRSKISADSSLASGPPQSSSCSNNSSNSHGDMERSISRNHSQSFKLLQDYCSKKMKTDELAEYHIKIEVEDNGIGMSEEAMQTLFAPFQQNQRLAGGTGLGLFSLHQRVEALQGRCGVRKRDDKKQGSVFWFTIPYRPDETMASLFEQAQNSTKNDILRSPVQQYTKPIFHAPFPTANVLPTPTLNISMPYASDSFVTNNTIVDHLESSCSIASYLDYSDDTPAITVNRKSMKAGKEESEEPNGSKLHILLVEDSRSIAKMTTIMLKKLGHRVTTAENGEVALSLMKSRIKQRHHHHHDQYDQNNQSGTLQSIKSFSDDEVGMYFTPGFDLVLMDLQMPVLDGLECTKRLRELEKTTWKPINCPNNYEDKNNYGNDLSISPWSCRHRVIALSASEDLETVHQAFESGCDKYLTKPVCVADVNSAIEEMIPLKQA